jgi:hypothetical protein
MQPIEVRLRRLLGTTVGNIWMQFDMGDGELAVGIFFKVPDCVVFIAVDDKTLVRGQREKRQHVAARQRRDKRRFGIDPLRIAQIGGRGGSRYLDAIIESPDVIAIVILIAEVGAVARPFETDFVLRHRTILRPVYRCDPAIANGHHQLARDGAHGARRVSVAPLPRGRTCGSW